MWEKDDGLKGEEFDPKTFFFLHGKGGRREEGWKREEERGIGEKRGSKRRE